MLSKLVHMPYDMSYDMETASYRIEPKNKNCSQELETWEASLKNGKVINIEIGRIYNMSNFTLELDREEYQNLINNSENGTVVINDFDYNVEYIRQEKDTWIEINGVPLNGNNIIPNINLMEKQELYRTIYKWDIIKRTKKSSGSESDSDSDFDEEKLSHNNCKHLSTKFAIINGFKLTEL